MSPTASHSAPPMDERLLTGLDPRQRDAVVTEAAPLAIIAAAGSGKTTVLTRRVAHRIVTGSADASHVLVLTFTRDAAGELRRRLRSLDIDGRVEAGTFHSVCLSLLRDRALAAGAAAPRVATDRLRLVAESLSSLRLRVDANAAAADLDWAAARLVTPESYDRRCKAAGRRSNVPASRYADLLTAYTDLKRTRGVVDFDDLLRSVLLALETDTAWADAMRWRFRHLFVDEAQDLNPLQHRLLETIRDGRPDLCLVGDPRQAIYGWNGADSAVLRDVEQAYPGVTVIRLDRNYRCSPQVVRAGAAALGASGQTDDSESDRPDTRAVTLESFDDADREARGVAAHVRQLLMTHAGPEIAVLARTNEQLGAIETALAALGIVTERSGGRSPLERAVNDAARCTSRSALAAWVDAALAEGSASPSDDVRRVALEADRFLATTSSGGFRAWLDEHSTIADDLVEQRADAVSLLTFHAAKGREWWGVVVTGVEDRLVPHSSAASPAQLEEEARLLYVALTRAEHHLHITYARRRGERDCVPSRWLDAIRATAVVDAAVPSPLPRRTSADPLAPFRDWRAAVARVSGMTERAVCSDEVLRSLHDEPPTDAADLARRLGLTPSAAARLRPLPISPASAPPQDA